MLNTTVSWSTKGDFILRFWQRPCGSPNYRDYAVIPDGRILIFFSFVLFYS